MGLVKPTLYEGIVNTLFRLESDRPRYYYNVILLGTRLFNLMDAKEYIQQLNDMIRSEIELPLQTELLPLLDLLDDYRFREKKSAYIKVGDSIDYKEITSYEIKSRLERIKEFVYDKVTELSQEIRFTQSYDIMN